MSAVLPISHTPRYILPFIEDRDIAGWRDVSEVESTGCSSEGSGFSSQYPHGSSQLPVTLPSGDPTPSH